MAEVEGCLVVTGASRGIGAAIARLAGARGYAVVVNYAADARAAYAQVDRIVRDGGQAIAVQADVGTETGVLDLFDAVDRWGIALTALINNAGVTGGFARVDDVSAATLERVFAVNAVGSFLCAREAVRRMSTRHGGQGGSIVNISSLAARLGSAGEWVHYAASKGAIDTMTIGLAREVAREGIRVNAVAPGLIETDLHAAAGAPERVHDMASGIPLGRAGTSEEIAEAVLWLLSPAAAYVTGAVLPVGGGR